MAAKTDPTRVQENKVLMTKLPREEYVRFQNYLDQRKEKPNAIIRRLILSEIDRPTKENLAGQNVFRYNQNNDRFSWQIELDDRSLLEITNDLSPTFIEQLLDQLEKSIAERNQFLEKKNKNSVPIPRKLRGQKK